MHCAFILSYIFFQCLHREQNPANATGVICRDTGFKGEQRQHTTTSELTKANYIMPFTHLQSIRSAGQWVLAQTLNSL
jgi:hypothetical protein